MPEKHGSTWVVFMQLLPLSPPISSQTSWCPHAHCGHSILQLHLECALLECSLLRRTNGNRSKQVWKLTKDFQQENFKALSTQLVVQMGLQVLNYVHLAPPPLASGERTQPKKGQNRSSEVWDSGKGPFALILKWTWSQKTLCFELRH